MTSVKLFNPNVGPLTLDHDSHPRDLATEKRIRDIPMHLRDFRYHGYPEENFIQPRMPEKRPLSDLEHFQSKQLNGQEFSYVSSKPEVTRENVDERFSRKFIEEYFKQNNAEEEKVPVEKKQAAPLLVDHFPEKRAQDVERIERERREAEEDIARFKAEQKKKLLEEAEEKKKEYERQTKFYFWDSRSYGHGAPKGDGDHRKHKFVEHDTSTRNQQHSEAPPHVPKGLHESAERYGGCGAPLKTESGSVKTQFKTHPAEQIQNNASIPQAIHEQLKYSHNFNEREQYGKELLRQRQERELFEQEQRIQELKKEIELLKGNDPFGKPGGGAPNRSSSESFIERKESDTYKPWGKGYGAMLRDEDGFPVARGLRNNIFPEEDDEKIGVGHCLRDITSKKVESSKLRKEDFKAAEKTHSVTNVREPIENKQTFCKKGEYKPTWLKRNDGHLETEQKLIYPIVFPVAFGDDAQIEGKPIFLDPDELVPVWDENGNIIGYTTKNLHVEEERKPMKPAGSSPRRRLPAEETADPYFPFGRPGGGAPIIDIEGNVITCMRNKLERNTTSADERRKARAARVYYQELKQEEAELKRQRQQMNEQLKAPEVELASLMKEGQVGKPRRDPITGMLLNQHLPLSDVSKVKMNAHYRDLDEQRIYHDDLTKQADDRHRLRELNRLKEKQQSKQHYDVMGDYWGRYGGGAPKDPVNRRKAALDNTLYSPGRELEYVKPRKDELNVKSDEEYNEKISPKYVRNIVNSTHKNHYDYSEDKSNRPYRQGAPYATYR